MKFLPRVFRLRDAPTYLGMDPNRFNTEVRPHIPEFPIGTQGRGFDRHDLDNWLDEYKRQHSKKKALIKKENETWQKENFLGCGNATASGTLTKPSMDDELQNLLAAASSTRRRNT